MSPRIAWSFIGLLSSEPVPDISDRELARLEGKCRTLLAFLGLRYYCVPGSEAVHSCSAWLSPRPRWMDC